MTLFVLNNDQGEAFRFQESYIDESTGEPVFLDPKKDAGTFYIRPMGPKMEEIQSRRKRSVEHVLNPKTRAMERVVYFEPASDEEAKAQNEELWDHVIAGWDDKVLDANKKKIPITVENKMLLLKIPAVDRFIGKCLRDQQAASVKSLEVQEKNSLSGSSGATSTESPAKTAK